MEWLNVRERVGFGNYLWSWQLGDYHLHRHHHHRDHHDHHGRDYYGYGYHRNHQIVDRQDDHSQH